MAYTYNPYEYQSAIGQRPQYDQYEGRWRIPSVGWTNETGGEWDIKSGLDKSSQFQDYAGEQFKGLFDIANAQANPLQGFAQTPVYSPYQGTRGDFTTGGEWYDEGAGGAMGHRPTVFDQQGYLDAQFGNINNYLSGLGSFLGNVSGDDASVAVRQGEIQRAMQRASLPQMPTMQPMQQSTYTGGGWGQASPTLQMGNMTQRQQAPAGILGTTNRGMYGGILGGE